MAITFTPSRGQLLICDFDMACVPPEMRKIRRVVVMSHRSHNSSGRLIVVPFSATVPSRILPSHIPVQAGAYLSFGLSVWAICDCVAHVSFRRLDRVFHSGRFISESLVAPDMQRIEGGLRHALGI